MRVNMSMRACMIPSMHMSMPTHTCTCSQECLYTRLCTLLHTSVYIFVHLSVCRASSLNMNMHMPICTSTPVLRASISVQGDTIPCIFLCTCLHKSLPTCPYTCLRPSYMRMSTCMQDHASTCLRSQGHSEESDQRAVTQHL